MIYKYIVLFISTKSLEIRIMFDEIAGFMLMLLISSIFKIFFEAMKLVLEINNRNFHELGITSLKLNENEFDMHDLAAEWVC